MIIFNAIACLVGTVVRRWTTVLEVVGSIPALAKQRIKDYKRSLVSLVAQVGNQWLAAGGNPVGAAI